MMGLFSKKPKIEKSSAPTEEPKNKISRGELTRQYSERTLTDFKKSGATEYMVRTCGDGRVCDNCKKQNGKKHKTKDAVIGKNAPPFCEECRCIMLPCFKGVKTPWDK